MWDVCPILFLVMTTDIWTLTDRLRKSRESVGLDTAAMARALDTSRTTISRWENGRTVPRRSDLIAWGLVTGFRWQWLATGDGLPRLDSNQQPAGQRRERRVAA